MGALKSPYANISNELWEFLTRMAEERLNEKEETDRKPTDHEILAEYDFWENGTYDCDFDDNQF